MGFLGAPPFWGNWEGKFFRLPPHYKLQSQKEHSEVNLWNLLLKPGASDTAFQRWPPRTSKDGGAHSHKSEGSGHGAGL